MKLYLKMAKNRIIEKTFFKKISFLNIFSSRKFSLQLKACLALQFFTTLFLITVQKTTLNATNFNSKNKDFKSTDYIQALKKVTDVMLNDVASPVAASRYYAYINLAANEIQAAYHPKRHPSLANKLNQFTGVDFSKMPVNQSNASLSSILIVLKMGEKMLPSGYLLSTQIDSIIAVAKTRGFSKKQIENSLNLTNATALALVQFAKSDGFTRLNSLPRYTPKVGAAWWQPTGPAFMQPIEPHWRTLRTFVLDSAQQFKPVPPSVYDTTKTSVFYQQMKEIYDIVNHRKPEEQAIAQFWDCNPFAVQQIGHVQFGLKKISPGGHWIGITGIACLQKKWNLQKTIIAHTLVSIVLADAFIACWDEKYRSNRVRPETAIRKLIDPSWLPLLQTPPFPEYVSGHSVASSAAATILSHLFGEKFGFNDDTEMEFGLPMRYFASFEAAAAEASISRLYGGIHFRDGIEQGVWQGKKVGEWALLRFGKD
jgi:hypothetical protein